MMFKIRGNMKKAKQCKKPDNHIEPHSLRKRMILEDALSGIATVKACEQRLQRPLAHASSLAVQKTVSNGAF